MGNRNNLLTVGPDEANVSTALPEHRESEKAMSADVAASRENETAATESGASQGPIESVLTPSTAAGEVSDREPSVSHRVDLSSEIPSTLPHPKSDGDDVTNPTEADPVPAVPAIPTVVVESSDEPPSIDDDIGPLASPPEQHAADADSNEAAVSPIADGDRANGMKHAFEGRLEFAPPTGLGWAGLKEESTFDSPRVEHAPLFAHECLFVEADDQKLDPQLKPHPKKPRSTLREIEVADDFNDPAIEPFPSERDHILEHILTTEHRLDEDETKIIGTPPSPMRPNLSHASISSNASCSSDEPGTSLQSIKEEDSDGFFGDMSPPTEEPSKPLLEATEADKEGPRQSRAEAKEVGEATDKDMNDPDGHTSRKTSDDDHLSDGSEEMQPRKLVGDHSTTKPQSRWHWLMKCYGEKRRET